MVSITDWSIGSVVSSIVLFVSADLNMVNSFTWHGKLIYGVLVSVGYFQVFRCH